MHKIKYLCVFLSILITNSSNADQSLINSCRAELRVCQLLNVHISTDNKGRGWDYINNEYPIDFLREIQDSYYDYFFCQETYELCLVNEKADVELFHKKMKSMSEVTWETSTPTAEGLSQESVDNAVEYASGIRDLKSLLIIKNGKLVSENYFLLKEDTRPQWIASVTKSVVALLIAIAIEKGFIESEYETIKQYFPNSLKNADPKKESIRIIDLLQMRSGLSYADLDYWFTYEPIEGHTYTDFWLADNAKDYALQFDMIAEPGESYLYNSPAVSLLTTILNHSTGMTAKEFADKYLFLPLGIDDYVWAHDSDEYYRGSHVLFMRPRGLAKIGQLVLDNGMYDSEEIISSEWIEKTFKVHQPKDVWDNLFTSTNTKLQYANLWYVTQVNGRKIRMAYGYGGNFILVVPEMDLVIVTTANNEVSFENGVETPDRIFKGIVSELVE